VLLFVWCSDLESVAFVTNTRRRITCGRRRNHYANAEALEAADDKTALAAAAGSLTEAGLLQQSGNGTGAATVATAAVDHKRRYGKPDHDKRGHAKPIHNKHGNGEPYHGEPDYGSPGYGGPGYEEPDHGKRDYDGPYYKVDDGSHEPDEHHGGGVRYVQHGWCGSRKQGVPASISRELRAKP
jgi:hypothetical protein